MLRITRSKGLLVALLLVTVVLASCGGTTTAAPTPVPASPAPAATPEPAVSPEDITSDGVVRMPMDDLKALIDRSADIVILDVRSAAEYKISHIKGALSLPWGHKLKPESVANLPKDKPIVTYCDCGTSAADSSDMAAKLIRAGFKDVKTLANGSTQWFAAGYPTQ